MFPILATKWLFPNITNMRSVSNVSDPAKTIRRKFSLLALLILVVILLFQYSCRCKDYWGKDFCYPPGSTFHEDNWEYLGFVKVTSDKSGPFTQKSRKTFRITVVDRKGNNYLKEILRFDCGDTDVTSSWDSFEVLDISLSEVGNEYSDDSYNRQLLKEGPRKLIDLEYHFDNSLNKFVKKAEAHRLE